MKLPKEGADGLPKDGFDWITLKVIFQGRFFVHSFLGMIVITRSCQEMDFIELFKRSFSRLERSGLAHFPIIIGIIQ